MYVNYILPLTFLSTLYLSYQYIIFYYVFSVQETQLLLLVFFLFFFFCYNSLTFFCHFQNRQIQRKLKKKKTFLNNVMFEFRSFGLGAKNVMSSKNIIIVSC